MAENDGRVYVSPLPKITVRTPRTPSGRSENRTFLFPPLPFPDIVYAAIRRRSAGPTCDCFCFSNAPCAPRSPSRASFCVDKQKKFEEKKPLSQPAVNIFPPLPSRSSSRFFLFPAHAPPSPAQPVSSEIERDYTKTTKTATCLQDAPTLQDVRSEQTAGRVVAACSFPRGIVNFKPNRPRHLGLFGIFFILEGEKTDALTTRGPFSPQ